MTNTRRYSKPPSGALAFDIATRCGYAFAPQMDWGGGGHGVQFGALDSHGTKGIDHPGRRYSLFARMVSDLIRDASPGVIYYESVPFVAGGAHAAHVWGGLFALIAEQAWIRRIPMVGKTPSEVKKHATGKGKAGKNAMVDAAIKRYGVELLKSQHDEADALHILDLGLTDDCGMGIVDVVGLGTGSGTVPKMNG